MRLRIFELGRGRSPASARREWRESTRYLPNPGQGWYSIYTYDAAVPFDPARDFFAEGETLALLRISLERYRESPLPDDCLENIRAILSFFDMRGVDLILRVAYDFEGRGLEKEPDLFSQVEEHLRQVALLVRAFEDRIVAFQGLLIGSWGEMHQSKFLSVQRIRALELAFRSGGNQKVWLALRRPAFLRALMGQGGRAGRRALFDDAIGGSDTDMGTFGLKRQSEARWDEPWAREDELKFIESFCADAPFGGEAVLPAKGNGMTPAEILRSMGRMHLSYLNCQHDPRQLDLWRKQKLRRPDAWDGISLCDYIGAHMGYRFCVRSASVKEEQGQQELRVEIENTGFGVLLQKAAAELVCIDHTGARHCQALDWDARMWRSGSRTVCTARLETPPGELYLGLRREWDGRPILFANEGAELYAGGGISGGYVSLC